jgi:hypothetical protein
MEAITLVSKDQIKEKFKYTTHTCALNKFLSKNESFEQCSFNKPAELKVTKVKTHYIGHFKKAKFWDHIVPIEGGKNVESYYCNL